MSEIAGLEDWQKARLIPVAGIRGQDEQEVRATSTFLAVLSAVPEFAYALLTQLGAPRGRAQTFTEVRLKDPDGKVGRPDGAIVVTRGARTWKALVEVKTGSALLTGEQTSRYLDLARDHSFDAVVTISSQITARPQDVPVDVDRRKTRRVALYHLSWWRIITTAVMAHRNQGITDPDQAWLLDELIAYLDHPNSGASGVQDMGGSWVPVRDGARQGTLRSGDQSVRDVAQRWEQLLDYLALGLSQQLGREVAPSRPRKQTHAERIDQHARRIVQNGELAGSLRVPDAVGAIGLVADLRARQVTASVMLVAPGEGRQLTRAKWLLRQLREADSRLRLSSSFANTSETSSVLLGDAHDQPQRLLSAADPRREIKGFEVALTRALGSKNGRGMGSFIAETKAQLFDFYGDVVQNLSAWQARAPRLPGVLEEPDVLAAPAQVIATAVRTDVERRVETEAERGEISAVAVGSSSPPPELAPSRSW